MLPEVKKWDKIGAFSNENGDFHPFHTPTPLLQIRIIFHLCSTTSTTIFRIQSLIKLFRQPKKI